MRMWNVEPKVMCRKHLLGEHVEMHMFAGCIKKGIKVDGYVKNGLVEVGKIVVRHNQLSKELTRRGYNHASIMEAFDEGEVRGKVNVRANLIELARRCRECAKLQGESV